MAMQLPSSSSSSSSSHGFKFDVFISFRGPDTRYGFTGNLYKALSDKGIHTFIDDEELKRGEEITPSLLKSIEDSRVAIVVFSKDYASSSFCLDELVHIIHCSNEKGSTVIPVFYGTEPSHVRKLNDSYGEALAKHEQVFQNDMEDMERLKKWKKALNQAANLSGHHFNLGNEYERDFIENIVTDVSYKINHVPFHVADYLVGLQSRISEVNSLLDLGSNDGVCIIGILGTGGMGKTTLAQAVYNLIFKQFECKCFLHNVRENSVKHGLVYLQEQLLSESIRFEGKVGHFNQGITIIKERLGKKKVLLILDDVDKLKQLQVLVGEPGWLGLGSRVIITTRDKDLLSRHGIEKIHEADGLNKEQALELLRKVAFKSNKNDSSYDSILNRAAKYASGLPLGLEVVGSNLFGKSIAECESLLDKYERIPHKDILKILKVSFDALDEEQQSVFLDIACFFKECKLAYIEEVLHNHYGHSIKSHLRVLVDKSLIKIVDDDDDDADDYVTLHDLIEDMGKEIVRQESPNNPGERSRLWFHDDIVKVLEEDMGTVYIKMIYLKCPIYWMSKNVIEWNGNAFKKMTNLKTLVIENVDFSKGPEYLPSGLRVLRWFRCPLISLSSCISNKKFNYMKDLELILCKYLTHIPDVSGLPNLEKFSLKFCKNLITIDNSVGQLDKLEILDVSHCEKIESFPPLRLPSLKELLLCWCQSLITIDNLVGQLDKLEILDVSCCTKLASFPPLRLPSLKELRLRRCESLITIDNSVGQLDKLEILDVSGCRKLESFPPLRLPSLKKLRLDYTWSLERFPEILCKMTNIKEIVLVATPIEDFPTSFQNLSEIRCLNIHPDVDDKKWFLEDLEDNDKMNSSENVVLSKVEYLDFERCSSLSDECLQMLLNWCLNVTRVDLSESNLKILPECLRECHLMRILRLNGCKFLEEIRGFPPNLKEFYALECYSLSSSSIRMLLSQKLHEAGYQRFCLITGTEGIPDWFEHQSRGHKTISFRFRKKIPSITVIIMQESKYSFHEVEFYVNDCPRDLPEGELYLDYINIKGLPPEHAVLFDLKLEEVLLENEWNTVKLKFENYIDGEERIRNVQMGIHVWKDKNNTEEDVIFTNTCRKRRKWKSKPRKFSIPMDSVSGMQNLVLTETKENQRLGEVGVSETEILQQQQLAALVLDMRNLVLTETEEEEHHP